MDDVKLEEQLSNFAAEGEAIAAFFKFTHLPPMLKNISRPFAAQAAGILNGLRHSAERTAGLRKLLEAKDCIVRAAL